MRGWRIQRRQERCRALTPLLASWLSSGVGDEFHAHRPSDHVGYHSVDGRAELSLQPRDVERIGSRDAKHTGARVIDETSGATQVRIEMGRASIELQARQHLLPDLTRIGF